jgi:hypothetical protein
MTTDTLLALIGVIFPVFVLIGGVSWRGSARLTHMEDKLDTAADAVTNAVVKVRELSDGQAEINRKLDGLPCHACPVTAPARWPVR